MKNIELIDKAIDALKGEVCNAADGHNHQYNFLWLDEVRGYRFTAGGQHYVGEYICKRTEFEARKAERQNKPDWKDVLSKHNNATHIAQWSDGEWMIYTAEPEADTCEEYGDGFYVTDDTGGNAYRTGVTGEVIGEWRGTLERRPGHIGETNEKAVTESNWPDESRIDVVGTNGNDGLHYATKAPEFKHSAGVFNLADDSPKTAADYLAACANVQLERGKQYDASGTGERSFDAAAEAFNCVTGKNLCGSDVCLILEIVKLVRQYSDPTRLHADSVLDKVSYSALWAEQITAELGK